MKIAVEGCAHGELEKIYDTIEGIEKSSKIKIDLLLCCGDFQSTRNLEDLQTMAVPKKYMDICTFYKYYSGERVAPVLTIFIGGNHEASNYLQELPYGGWVAPNIYYLGYAGVVNVKGVRIAGISGIYKGHDFLRGHYEFPPYTDSTCRSVYHVRQLEVFRLKQLSGNVDLFMSHDWPRGIWNYGNKSQLLKVKPFFANDMESGQLGSRPMEELLKAIKPSFWFAAHLHCKFAALVPHNGRGGQAQTDSSDDSGSDGESDHIIDRKAHTGAVPATKFLALDKCLPKRRFLQVLDVPAAVTEIADNQLSLEYDIEWLTILLITNHLTSIKNNNYFLPGKKAGCTAERHDFTPSPEELAAVRRKFKNLKVPQNFCRTVPPYDPNEQSNYKQMHISQPNARLNPQCTEFCKLLGIDDPLSLAMLANGKEPLHSSSTDAELVLDEDVSLLETGIRSEPSPPKRKLNLSLPAVSTSVSNDVDENVIQLPPEEPDPNVMSYNEMTTVTSPTLEINSQILEAPKFKRRNQSIYNAEDNDDVA